MCSANLQVAPLSQYSSPCVTILVYAIFVLLESEQDRCQASQLSHELAPWKPCCLLPLAKSLCLQIVTMGVPDVSPIKAVGTYVSPREWNDLISDPDTVS